MLNGINPPIRRKRDLIGRKEEMQMLSQTIESRQNTVIMGVEGVGKTSFLNTFFNREYRLKKIGEGTIIACTQFRDDLDTDAVYGLLTDAIVNETISLLPYCSAINQDFIKKRIKEYRDNSSNPASELEMVCKCLVEEFEYDIYIVFDGFEKFTSSPNVTMDHHNLMCRLLDSRYLYFVVATNYDLNKNSLPEDVTGSYFLSRLNGRITLYGLSKSEATQYIKNYQNLDFHEAIIEELYYITGGIPYLLQIASNCVVNRGLANGQITEEQWYDMEGDMLHDIIVINLLRHWCSSFGTNQIKFINLLAGNEGALRPDNDIDRGTASILHERGLLIKGERNYMFNSGLLLDYCSSTALKAGYIPPRNPEKGKKYIKPATICNIYGNLIHKETNVTVGEIKIHNLLNVLDSPSADQLVDGLSKFFPMHSIQESYLAGLSMPERMDLAESMANEISDRLETISDYTQEEENSLIDRFNSISAKYDVDARFLDALSDKCRTYCMLALVVEDALEDLNCYNIGDFSAQLVMYGKVLEQSMRDYLGLAEQSKPSLYAGSISKPIPLLLSVKGAVPNISKIA